MNEQPSQLAAGVMGTQGATVYELNAWGCNRWSAQVQPGHDDSGKRISDEECAEIALHIAIHTTQGPQPVALQASDEKGVWSQFVCSACKSPVREGWCCTSCGSDEAEDAAPLDTSATAAAPTDAMIQAALPIVREYARKNPKHEYDGQMQDPKGAHAWLDRYSDRAAPPDFASSPAVPPVAPVDALGNLAGLVREYLRLMSEPLHFGGMVEHPEDAWSQSRRMRCANCGAVEDEDGDTAHKQVCGIHLDALNQARLKEVSKKLDTAIDAALKGGAA